MPANDLALYDVVGGEERADLLGCCDRKSGDFFFKRPVRSKDSPIGKIVIKSGTSTSFPKPDDSLFQLRTKHDCSPAF